MRLLLDTHVLLWWLADSPRLTKPARTLIAGGSQVFVSAGTAWEISIKRALGKLTAPDDLEAAVEASQFEPLPISVRHTIAAGDLAHFHEDPFDRLLVAQAKCEGLRLVTGDSRLAAYGPEVMLLGSVR